MNSLMLAQLMKDLQVSDSDSDRPGAAFWRQSCRRHPTVAPQPPKEESKKRRFRRTKQRSAPHVMPEEQSPRMHSQNDADPEIMREAQQMMNDPAFQAQMKKVTESQQFKQHMSQQQEMLKDPEKVKELEKKMQEKLKEGNSLLDQTMAEKAKLEAEKDGGDSKGDKKEGTKKEGDSAEEDGDKKQSAKTEEEEEDDMPDIPNLNLN
ncbi:MAG: hypothetical protein SGILL_004482 [Bacillariaceae sp.]